MPDATITREQHALIHRFFRTRVPASDLEDQINDTFQIFLAKYKNPEVRDSMRYLRGIATKVLLRYIERKKRDGGQPFDSQVHPLPWAKSPASSVGTRLDRAARDLRVRNAFAGLPADIQLALGFRYGDDLPLQEVAETIEVSLATAKRRIRQGLDMLRDQVTVEDRGDDVTMSLRDALRGA